MKTVNSSLVFFIIFVIYNYVSGETILDKMRQHVQSVACKIHKTNMKMFPHQHMIGPDPCVSVANGGTNNVEEGNWDPGNVNINAFGLNPDGTINTNNNSQGGDFDDYLGWNHNSTGQHIPGINFTFGQDSKDQKPGKGNTYNPGIDNSGNSAIFPNLDKTNQTDGSQQKPTTNNQGPNSGNGQTYPINENVRPGQNNFGMGQNYPNSGWPNQNNFGQNTGFPNQNNGFPNPNYGQPNVNNFGIPNSQNNGQNYPFNNGQFPFNNGQPPLNNGQFPFNTGQQFPLNNGQFPLNNGQFPYNNGPQFPYNGQPNFGQLPGNFGQNGQMFPNGQFNPNFNNGLPNNFNQNGYPNQGYPGYPNNQFNPNSGPYPYNFGNNNQNYPNQNGGNFNGQYPNNRDPNQSGYGQGGPSLNKSQPNNSNGQSNPSSSQPNQGNYGQTSQNPNNIQPTQGNYGQSSQNNGPSNQSSYGQGNLNNGQGVAIKPNNDGNVSGGSNFVFPENELGPSYFSEMGGRRLLNKTSSSNNTNDESKDRMPTQITKEPVLGAISTENPHAIRTTEKSVKHTTESHASKRRKDNKDYSEEIIDDHKTEKYISEEDTSLEATTSADSNSTIVPVTDGKRILSNVKANCPEGFVADKNGVCREKY